MTGRARVAEYVHLGAGEGFTFSHEPPVEGQELVAAEQASLGDAEAALEVSRSSRTTVVAPCELAWSVTVHIPRELARLAHLDAFGPRRGRRLVWLYARRTSVRPAHPASLVGGTALPLSLRRSS